MHTPERRTDRAPASSPRAAGARCALALACVASIGAGAHAAPAAGAASAASAASAPISPAKKALIQRIVQLQQPVIDNLARQLAEQPPGRILQSAAPLLQQRIPADKREAVAKDIQAEAKAYVDGVLPLLKARATALAPTAFGNVLDAKLSVAELKEVESFLQSPAVRKYMETGNDLQRALAEQLVADTRPTVEPKLRALEQSIAHKLGLDAPAPGASAPPGK